MLTLVIGKRELGKTTLAVSISREYDTCVIFDPRHMIDTTSDIISDEGIDTLYSMMETRNDIIVRPKFDIEGTFEKMCSQLYQYIKAHPEEKICLLVDESRFVPSPEKIKEFDYIVRCTPRSNVAVIMTCHGIVDVSTNLRRILDYMVLFHLTLNADLDTIGEKCGWDVVDAVKSLKPYEYVIWNDSNSTWKKVTDSQRWFVPLSMPKLVTERVAV
jgi:hypothetical protein